MRVNRLTRRADMFCVPETEKVGGSHRLLRGEVPEYYVLLPLSRPLVSKDHASVCAQERDTLLEAEINHVLRYDTPPAISRNCIACFHAPMQFCGPHGRYQLHMIGTGERSYRHVNCCSSALM